MGSRLTEVIIDASDIEGQADFWCAVLGYERAAHGDGWLAIGPLGAPPTRGDALSRAIPPHISFVRVPEAKSVKNRVHLDVTPLGSTQAEEVARITSLGAKPVDVGQSGVNWVVLADPEGNEFCVMSEWSED